MQDTLNALQSIIPAKYRPYLPAIILALPYVTRALHALYNGRGIVGAIKGIFLGTNTPGDSQPATAVGVVRGKIPLLCAGASLLLMAGCTTAINSGHIVSVTERGFGIIVAQSTQNETPEVKLGFFSSAIVLEPTVTNSVLTAPAFANTFAIQDGLNPFTFGVNETIASGDYQTGNVLATNPVASQPIVPSTNGNWPPSAAINATPAASSAATSAAAVSVPSVLSVPLSLTNALPK